MASFRFSLGVISGRKDEMAQTSHHRYSLLQKFSQANIFPPTHYVGDKTLKTSYEVYDNGSYAVLLVGCTMTVTAS